jgi:hypothetical protein
LKRLLHREVYLGRIVDSHSGTTVEGAHPALIDPATFKAAVARKGTKHAGSYGKDEPLSGLVRCGWCRYRMRRPHAKEKSGRAIRLGCGRYIYAKDCPHPATIQLATTEWMAGKPPIPLKSVGLEPFVMEQVKDFLRQHEEELRVYGADEGLDGLKTEAERAEAEYESNAAAPGLDELLGDEGLRHRLTALRLQAEEKRRLYEEKAEAVGRPLIDRPIGQLVDAMDDMPVEDLRDLYGALIQEIFVGPSGPKKKGASSDRVKIVWVTDPPVDVPRPGVHGWKIPNRSILDDSN